MTYRINVSPNASVTIRRLSEGNLSRDLNTLNKMSMNAVSYELEKSRRDHLNDRFRNRVRKTNHGMSYDKKKFLLLDLLEP